MSKSFIEQAEDALKGVEEQGESRLEVSFSVPVRSNREHDDAMDVVKKIKSNFIVRFEGIYLLRPDGTRVKVVLQ